MRWLMILLLVIPCYFPPMVYAREVAGGGQMLIKQFEGLRLCQYNDVAGKPTIGYGHLILPHESFPRCITPFLAHELFVKDLAGKTKCMDDYIINWPQQNQWDALGSFTFNLGCGAFKRSTLLRQVNADPMQESIGQEFMRWVYAGGKKWRGLELRRFAEKTLYFNIF